MGWYSLAVQIRLVLSELRSRLKAASSTKEGRAMAGRSAKAAGGGGEGVGEAKREVKRSGRTRREGKDDVAGPQREDPRTKATADGESTIKPTLAKEVAPEAAEGQGKGTSEGSDEARLKGMGKGRAKGEGKLKSEGKLEAVGEGEGLGVGEGEGEERGGVSAARERFWRTSALGRPKRSAFFNFMEGIRTRLPGQSPREIARRAPALWRELSAEEKQPYLDMAEQARRLPPLPDGKSSTSYVTVHLDKEAWGERLRRSAARGGEGVGGRTGASAERLHGPARARPRPPPPPPPPTAARPFASSNRRRPLSGRSPSPSAPRTSPRQEGA
ncbi:Protein of unknown function [Gryllus bimaculatus]|nr:Protein of unknown function [Gryllus bimaculatus]